jgi:hypothetical protein
MQSYHRYFENFDGAVCGTTIFYNQFFIGISLAINAFNASFKSFFAIEYCNDDGEDGIFVFW